MGSSLVLVILFPLSNNNRTYLVSHKGERENLLVRRGWSVFLRRNGFFTSGKIAEKRRASGKLNTYLIPDKSVLEEYLLVKDIALLCRRCNRTEISHSAFSWAEKPAC